VRNAGISIIVLVLLAAPFVSANPVAMEGYSTIIGGMLVFFAGIVAVLLIIALAAIKALRWINARKQPS
jgi:hypothetical protein